MSATAGAPATPIRSARTSNGAGPSGVRYRVGILGIDPLDEQILGVGAGVGEAPGYGAVVPQHHRGQARQGRPDQPEPGGLEVGEVPHAGRLQAEMRIVGEQRRPPVVDRPGPTTQAFEPTPPGAAGGSTAASSSHGSARASSTRVTGALSG